ncbi:hypothetical protein [Planobispora longispora]|uniref:PIN domain-containing protein n=1 Tax=Planobispora longispora TaxID=28887 RepID=A0A8J3RW19_9ACTN|nr:hypothetical protein [Planobispora longispora]BFE89190.1 hypothetical protein GCM10020093_117920 [Planobispora longispora]BFE89275.1 hypothetical protein GCM10020093_118770 [Planobispora longispora]BFE89431.1 hypothetical protein GCM10020093_120330 [Planobispora longispora]GIH80982.1 hypothetical protein Plo01_74110 [Planobispora longispora]
MPADPAFVLDAMVLTEVARGDSDTIILLQQLDAEKITLIVPALAVTGAAVDVGCVDEQLATVRGVCRLNSAKFVGPATFDDSADLAQLRLEIESLGELWDVHTAVQAILHGCPILTTDYGRWKDAVLEARGALSVVEVTDLDD